MERTPEAVVLIFEDQILTYAELNRRANQLAHYLQNIGIDPEDGWHLRGTVYETIVGLLGDPQSGRKLCSTGPGLS